jgi:lysophospholipase L1-like esterase
VEWSGFSLKQLIAGAVVVLITVAVGWEVIALVKLKLSVHRYAAYWQAAAERTRPPRALMYVALGDSTAQGVGASRPENGYVGLFAKQLAEGSGRPVHVINLSRSGAEVGDVLFKQVPAMRAQSLRPDVVTVAIGANNVPVFDEQHFTEQFTDLAGALPKGTLVADLPWFGGRRHGQSETARHMSRIVRRVVARYRQLVPVELEQATQGADSPRMYAADFFHPSDHAYRVWAGAFWDAYSRK